MANVNVSKYFIPVNNETNLCLSMTTTFGTYGIPVDLIDGEQLFTLWKDSIISRFFLACPLFVS